MYSTSPSENLNRAILVHVNFSRSEQQEDLQELHELALSAGANPIASITTSRQSADAKYFIGLGKAEELKACVNLHQAELILVNHALSPSQERNLERLCQCRVLDRTGLILDIFAQRARTFEGKLQVELAQLQHLATRLVRGWTHLERQKGGIGLRGPGETQLETDRRLLKARVDTIRQRLAKVRQQRAQGRKARQRSQIPTISLVGYTNAGKSTLFNCLTASKVYAANQLFATLDPTLRRLRLGPIGDVILADTVGFIRHLPHDLVEAFRATLEETTQADLLLHVIDASDPEFQAKAEQVVAVLTTIDAQHVPRLAVFNKIDQAHLPPRLETDEQGMPIRVWISAGKHQGIDLLLEAIGACLKGQLREYQLRLSPQHSKLRAQLYQQQAVIKEVIDEQGHWLVTVRMNASDFNALQSSLSLPS